MSSRSARGICGSSFTSTSSIISVRETTRDSTTSSCHDRHPPVRADADVQRRERLGGLLSFYYREAA